MIMYFNVKREPEDRLLKPALTPSEECLVVCIQLLQVHFCLTLHPTA